MEKPLLTSWVGHKFGWAEPQGLPVVEQSVLVKLMESQIWPPPPGSVVGGLRKGTMVSVLLSVMGKDVCPSALILMSDTSVPPHMPLVPFKPLPQCWNSEGVNLSR